MIQQFHFWTYMDMYAKELKTEPQWDIWTPIFIAALFIIAKMCKQSKYPMENKDLKNVVWNTI